MRHLVNQNVPKKIGDATYLQEQWTTCRTFAKINTFH